MATFITEEEYHVAHGHRKRFRWQKRTKYTPGPLQWRSVILVQEEPRFDTRRSTTVPIRYDIHWYLECGHRVLPSKKNPYAPWPESRELADPETTQVLCTSCQNALATREEERYKEYYWEDSHKHREMACRVCRQCVVCKGHKQGCIQESRDFLMEMIWECLVLHDMEDDDRDQLKDTIQSLIDSMDRPSLKKAWEPYNDHD